MRRKVAIIVGTRPEGIKMAPVADCLRQRADIEFHLISTGQHQEMLEQALRPFSLDIYHNFNVMVHNQSLFDLTSKIVSLTGDFFTAEKYDAVLVQGDTTSAMAASLSAFYCGIPIGHVEAGLRSFDMRSPFPEEGNRRLISQLATLHFAPTKLAELNLLKEGVSPKQIFVTGNTVIDALLYVRSLTPSPIAQAIIDSSEGRRIVLVTTHRRENWGSRIDSIFTSIRKIADEREDVYFVCPLHRNKLVRNSAELKLGKHPRIETTEPLSYQDLISVMARSHIIMTDSGGIQEEAPSLNIPLLILRTETERPEVLSAGAGVLVGSDPEKISYEFSRLFDNDQEYKRMADAQNPFGDGEASEMIVQSLINWLD